MSNIPPNIIITFPDSLHAPGGGTVGCISIAHALSELGIDVTLIPVSRPVGPQPEDPLITVRPTLPSRIHYLLDGLGTLSKVRSVCATQAVSAVVSWSHEGAFLPDYLRGRGISFSMIAAFPDYRLLESRRVAFGWAKGLADLWFRKRPLRRANVVFALSTFTAGQLTKIMGVDPSRIKRTYWGVAPTFLQVPRRRRSTISRYVYFGALTEEKGAFDLLHALARVRQLGRESWELRVAGWGEEDMLREEAATLGIMEQVTFLGRLDHLELLKVLEWADLAILPSRAESFGLAIAEAQAAGLPVISCRVGAVPEVVRDEITGWLVKARDTKALANAVITAMREPELAFRMGTVAREMVRTHFTWEATAEEILRGLAPSSSAER